MNKTSFPTARTAVITGAGTPRGIGRSVAQRLAAEGWSLALLDLDAEGLDRVRAELAEQAQSIVAVPTDVTDSHSVDAAFSVIDDELPPVVGLVNLAGIASSEALLDIDVDMWRRVLDVNVTGSLLTLRHAARRMMANGVGRVVNTSSITAFDGGGTFSKGAYAAAKSAVLGLTRGAARELGEHGITVNAIAPGPIDTDIMGGMLSEERKAVIAADVPVGRVGQPSEVGALVAFLLSAEAGFISGATHQIDGGKYMH